MLKKMAVFDDFCNPKMLSRGDEKIIASKLFNASTFSYLKTWFKKTDLICNFFMSWLFPHKIVCLITKKIKLYSNPFYINSQIGYYLLKKKNK